jgi:hypothetical protein
MRPEVRRLANRPAEPTDVFLETDPDARAALLARGDQYVFDSLLDAAVRRVPEWERVGRALGMSAQAPPIALGVLRANGRDRIVTVHSTSLVTRGAAKSLLLVLVVTDAGSATRTPAIVWRSLEGSDVIHKPDGARLRIDAAIVDKVDRSRMTASYAVGTGQGQFAVTLGEDDTARFVPLSGPLLRSRKR